MKKISIASAVIAAGIIAVPTFSASAGMPTWTEGVESGDKFYAQSTWIDDNHVAVGTTFDASTAASINDVLFSETDGIDYTITFSGDDYNCEGFLCKETGKTYTNQELTDITDMVAGPGTVVDVTMEVVNEPTTADFVNLSNLATEAGFSDEQLENVVMNNGTETAVATTTNTDGTTTDETSTVLSANPISTSTDTDDDQSIALTGEVK